MRASFWSRQPRSPTHKVDKKEKDRAAMRSWFTPRRMTDPLSGASFNALTDERERTLITIARAKRHDAEFSSLHLFFLLFLSFSTLSDARRALSTGEDTMWYRVASLAKSIESSGDQSFVYILQKEDYDDSRDSKNGPALFSR